MNKPELSKAGNNQQNVYELGIIVKIIQSIISTLDYEKILQIISDGMSELLGIESAAIYLLDNPEELLLSATTPPLGTDMPLYLRKAFLKDHPHIEEAVSERKPVFLPNTQTAKLSDAERKITEMRNLRSLLYLPFVQENTVLGILILGTCKESRKFSPKEIEFGQTLANQLSIAIQNSRFHTDLTNYKNNLEKIVAERTSELEAANEELKTINDELNERNNLVIKQKKEIEISLEALKAMQVKLIQSEKMASLGVLTAGIAHEINNPLNFMMGAYQGLNEFFKTNAPEHQQYVSVLLDGLKSGIERASAIVIGLNQFSRDNKTYNENCHINAIIDNCLVMLHHQFKNKIHIDKNYDKNNFTIKGNVGKLHQLFTNILLNSVQAIENHGNIQISTLRNADMVNITISDNGCGIEAANLPKVMDPFFTTKEPTKGTGLGLAIAYNIIKDHKGQIDINSIINKGTTVSINLPIFNKI
ncbi:MAG: GAF domain-containing protein [Bacteroidales bacterium]|nr:GAF domain-containing protein [Bacteroidales bacterium]